MRRSTARFALRASVSVSFLALLALVLDPRAVVDRLSSLRPAWAAAALGVSVLQIVVSAWRWRFTAGRLGVALPFSTAVGEYYLATFLNQVLPGGVLGDVSRAWRHVRSTTASLALRPVHAVVLERLSGQAVMTLVACVSVGFLMGFPAALVLFGLSAAGALVVARLGLARVPAAKPFLSDARAALLQGNALPVQLLSSFLAVASYVVVFLMGARAIGVTTPTTTLLPLLAPVLVTMLLPVTVAGWGVREGAAAWLWGAVGLTASDGVAISVAYGLLVLVSTLPGAAVLIVALVRSGGRDRTARPDPDETSVSGDEAPGLTSRSSEA